MKTASAIAARKRPVNLSLNEHLVAQARGLTDNLSGVVETLLADYVEQARQQQLAEKQALEKTTMLWNEFNARHGAFADDHSTL